jgi:hypothetical protein
MTTESGPALLAATTRFRGRLLAFSLAGFLAFAAVGAALLAPWVERRVQARLTHELTRRWPGARLDGGILWRWPAGMEVGPLSVRGEDGRAVLRVERLAVRLRLRSLLAGDIVPGRMRLDGVELDLGEDGRALSVLKPAAAGSTRAGAQRASERFDLLAEVVNVRLSHAHRDLSWGPWRVEAWRDAKGWHAAAQAPASGRVEVSRVDGAAEALLRVERLSLAALQGGVPAAALEGATLDADGVWAPGRWNGLVSIEGLFVDDERFASEPVGPLAASFDGAVSWRREPASSLDLKGRLGAGALAADVVVGVRRSAKGDLFDLDVATHEATFAAVVSALPPALRVEAVEGLDGPVSASLHVSGVLSDRPHWVLEPKLDLSTLKREGRRRPSPLRETFVHRPLTSQNQNRGRALVVGPSNPFFVPLASMPPLLVRSVLLSEDAGFYGHQGFEFSSLVEYLLKNREEGELVRGGSTLTQQLAKNLFLSREKSYARKLREALATVALEAQLGKERLLEIYLNTIEWGPDIYGVGEAARHYFAKPVQELTTLESAFLATIIPNPVRYHAYCRRGELSEAWTARVATLLAKLHDTGDLTDEAWTAAGREMLVFHHPSGPSVPTGIGGADDAPAEPVE